MLAKANNLFIEAPESGLKDQDLIIRGIFLPLLGLTKGEPFSSCSERGFVLSRQC